MDARVKPRMTVGGIGDCPIAIRPHSPNNPASFCLAKHANADFVLTERGLVFQNQYGVESRSSENRKIHVISVRYIKCDIEPPQNLLHRSTAHLT